VIHGSGSDYTRLGPLGVQGARAPIVTAWLGAAPELRARADVLVGLVDSVLALVEPWGVESVSTSEPHTYRLSPRGRAQLARALADGRVDDLVLASPLPAPSPGQGVAAGAVASVFPGGGRSVGALGSVGIRLAVGPGGGVAETTARLVAFLRQWFAAIDASAAFVSLLTWERFPGGGAAAWRQVGDAPELTALEREPDRGTLEPGPAVRRFARGAFWGTGLGRELCARLGGRERVLQEAPVPLRQALGEGVWLQVSEAPPAEAAALARLAAYMAPLLNWTRSDVRALVGAVRPPPVDRAPQPAATPPRPAARARVPVRWLESIEESEIGLNVYLTTEPDREQLVRLRDAVEAWYAANAGGALAGKGFQLLGGPSVDGVVVRWSADLGAADPLAAVADLARRLASLPGPEVTRLEVGTEEVG
jgi:hypothetical protein